MSTVRVMGRRLTKRMASWQEPVLHRTLSAVEEGAESSKLWCECRA